MEWLNPIRHGYERLLRVLVLALAMLSGLGIVGMMAMTCADVIMRAFGKPIRGSYDVVCLLSVVALACALPYTTAVKGHVAVEYFFHKLPKTWRVAVDSVMRLLMIALFALLAEECVKYGLKLRQAGELMPTLHLPVYGVPWIIAFSCAVSALVVVYHLLLPGKVVIRP